MNTTSIFACFKEEQIYFCFEISDLCTLNYYNCTTQKHIEGNENCSLIKSWLMILTGMPTPNWCHCYQILQGGIHKVAISCWDISPVRQNTIQKGFSIKLRIFDRIQFNSSKILQGIEFCGFHAIWIIE